MYIQFEEDGNLHQLEAIIRSLDSDEQIKGIMIFTCDENQFSEEAVNKILINTKTKMFGGVFPSIIYDGKKHDRGSIVVGFYVAVDTKIIHDINNPKRLFRLELEKFYNTINIGKTFLVNIDGLSEGVEAFKEEVFYTLGLSKNYIGGGAGSLSFSRKPCVITNEGLLQDAAVIALVDVRSGIGVAHGWENVSEPLKVTQSSGNHIISLNWEPALHVYMEKVESLSGEKFTKDNFFKLAKGYPFGIAKMDNEMVVRDPIEIIDETTIVSVGAIPQNDFVYILKGNKESLIEGAKTAKKIAYKAFLDEYGEKSSDKSVTLFIDCISRVLFLEDDFQKELDAVYSKTLIGALTLGEIANAGKSYLEFYNKTSVIGILED